MAMGVAVQHWLDRPGMGGVTVAVQGLGAVGGPLCRGMLESGVGGLVVADRDAGRLEAFLASLPEDGLRERVEVAPPEEVLFREVDVVSPNAVGGVLGTEEIERLNCRMVMGAANNQLRAHSQEEELALARALQDRGILYQVDWMHNTAGVIAGCEEWENQEEARMERVFTRVRAVCVEGVRDNLQRARRSGTTPTAAAYEAVEEALYGTD